jgi:Uma2 family endonuclease
MVMAVSLRRFTVDELDAIPPDGNRYELLDGVLFVTPPPGPIHEEVVTRLITLTVPHLKPWPRVRVVPRSEVARLPDTRIEPDLLVYAADRLPQSWSLVSERWLAVEVASRSSRLYDRTYKLDGYLAMGVLEVWLVDPRARTVTVGRPGGDVVVVRDEFIWAPPPPVAPCRVDLAELFRGLPDG